MTAETEMIVASVLAMVGLCMWIYALPRRGIAMPLGGIIAMIVAVLMIVHVAYTVGPPQKKALYQTDFHRIL